MSTFDTEDSKREIIIVKRGGGDHEDGHHGGVWKIAFADFMTAMMCFFLVMWLINATSEQTKAAIASYFNPMTLVDKSPSKKGLDDPGEPPPVEETPAQPSESVNRDQGASDDARGGPGQFPNSDSQEKTQKTSDEHLFADPYAVLAEIAAQTATLQNVSEKGEGGAQTSGPATGAQGGDSYRDPFAPNFWSQEVAGAEDDTELDVFREAQKEAPEAEAGKEAAAATQEQAAPQQAEQAQADQQQAGQQQAGQQQAGQEAAAQKPAEAAQTQEVAQQIRREIAEAFGRDSALNKAVSVTVENGGVMISVTDELNFGMFEVGSAVPKGELVLAMEKIGHTLSEHRGKIRINGHTDGRPFRNAAYDNWRLSTARAHSAYYMLVRAGMDEARIKEVAGFADRQLKLADDPLANVNRRIEIFLETDG